MNYLNLFFSNIRRYSAVFLLLFLCYGANSQPDFICLTGTVPELPESQPRMICDPTATYADLEPEEAALLPSQIIRVNFHLIGNNGENFEQGPDDNRETNGNNFVDQIIDRANQKLSNLQPNLLGGGNDFLGDTRVRVQRYSEGLGDDNGIWFWDDDQDYLNNATFPYGENVIDILLTHDGSCNRRGEYFLGDCGNGVSHKIEMESAFPSALRAQTRRENNLTPIYIWPCSGPWKFGDLLMHELGHAAGLTHAWDRYNPCSVYPDDPVNNPQAQPCAHGTIHTEGLILILEMSVTEQRFLADLLLRMDKAMGVFLGLQTTQT